MKVFKALFIATLLLTILQSCKQFETQTGLTAEGVIPKPVSVISTGKNFSWTAKTKILVNGSNELLGIGNYLSSELSKTTGFNFVAEPTTSTPDKGNIYLVLGNADPKIGTEGYELEITKDLITLKANQPAGLFMGVQTYSKR
jgi:hexosaminidase